MNSKNTLTPERIAEIKAREIDLSDIPELTHEDFERGYFRNLKYAKKPVSFRIDLDNLQWLQSDGVKGYQKRLNEVLRWARLNGCPLVGPGN